MLRGTSGDWEVPEPGELIPLLAGWPQAIVARYAGRREPAALHRCLKVAEALGATTAFVETRYIDADYRSEYSAHFSRAFIAAPATTHRIHFFSGGPLSSTKLCRLPRTNRYLGYVIVAPSSEGRVGRTMLQHPPVGYEGEPLADVLARAEDHPHLFGQRLTVAGVPFMEQDSQFGRCVHVVAWMTHHTAYLQDEASRMLMSRFTEWRPGAAMSRAPFPSDGLSADEFCAMLGDFDLPPLYRDLTKPWPRWTGSRATEPRPSRNLIAYADRVLKLAEDDIPAMYWDPRIIDYCQRYLDSGIPVIVGKKNHALVVCGYRYRDRTNMRSLQFVGHDDRQGPYVRIMSPFRKRQDPWLHLFVPVPPKLWVPLDEAMWVGEGLLMSMVEDRVPGLALRNPESERLGLANAAATRLRDLDSRHRLWYRTYAIASEQYKARIAVRLRNRTGSSFDAIVGRSYQLMRFSKHIVVTEMIDRDLWERGDPCPVLGEAIIDGTTRTKDPHEFAVHSPGVFSIRHSDGTEEFPIFCGLEPHQSLAPGDL